MMIAFLDFLLTFTPDHIPLLPMKPSKLYLITSLAMLLYLVGTLPSNGQNASLFTVQGKEIQGKVHNITGRHVIFSSENFDRRKFPLTFVDKINFPDGGTFDFDNGKITFSDVRNYGSFLGQINAERLLALEKEEIWDHFDIYAHSPRYEAGRGLIRLGFIQIGLGITVFLVGGNSNMISFKYTGKDKTLPDGTQLGEHYLVYRPGYIAFEAGQVLMGSGAVSMIVGSSLVHKVARNPLKTIDPSDIPSQLARYRKTGTIQTLSGIAGMVGGIGVFAAGYSKLQKNNNIRLWYTYGDLYYDDGKPAPDEWDHHIGERIVMATGTLLLNAGAACFTVGVSRLSAAKKLSGKKESTLAFMPYGTGGALTLTF